MRRKRPTYIYIYVCGVSVSLVHTLWRKRERSLHRVIHGGVATIQAEDERRGLYVHLC